jgi:hypothetical protein
VIVRTLKAEEYFIETEPCYEPVGNVLTVFEGFCNNQLPVLLKGPTGCGKTRFVALEFDSTSAEREAKILMNETGINKRRLRTS